MRAKFSNYFSSQQLPNPTKAINSLFDLNRQMSHAFHAAEVQPEEIAIQNGLNNSGDNSNRINVTLGVIAVDLKYRMLECSFSHQSGSKLNSGRFVS
jgi:hypothetical protein